jgi:hypothetical protein
MEVYVGILHIKGAATTVSVVIIDSNARLRGRWAREKED